MTLSPTIRVCGLLLFALSVAMALTGLVDLGKPNGAAKAFFQAAALCLIIAGFATLGTLRMSESHFSLRQGFLLTVMAWLVGALASAVPFLLVLPEISYADAFFEAMSGITTTGATVLVGLDEMPASILLWRSLLQWFGGVGFVVTGMAVLPALRVGGMQLFRTESSDRYDKMLPQAATLAGAIGRVYLVLTVLCIIAYMIAGMPPFDAINHGMTTVATAGYSTHDASFGYFADQPAIEWVAIVFMLVGSIGFTHYIVMMRGRFSRLTSDPQVRMLFGTVLVAPILLVIAQEISVDVPLTTAIREALFNAVSVISTTGYVSADYSQWSPMAVGVFFLLYFAGGCTGSTAGSVKMFRWYILAITMNRLLMFMVSPKRVMALSYRGRPVEVDTQVSVLLFFFAFVLTILMLTLILSIEGYDLLTCLSAASAAVSNVGPGLGSIVGPAGNFAPLSGVSKLSLSIGMMLGRLEIFTVLVLFTAAYWRR